MFIIFTFVHYFRMLMAGASKYAIPCKGLGAGNYRFEFGMDDSLFSGRENCDIKSGRGNIRVEAVKGAAGMELEVGISGEVVVECDRCLDDCTLAVDCDERVKVRFSDSDQESDGEVIWVAPGEDFLDLAQYIYESIVLSLPAQRVHPLDSNGDPLCNPDMLGRFRLVTQVEFDEAVSPSAGVTIEERL